MIRLRNLERSYPLAHGKFFYVLRDINIDVAEGEFVVEHKVEIMEQVDDHRCVVNGHESRRTGAAVEVLTPSVQGRRDHGAGFPADGLLRRRTGVPRTRMRRSW